MNDERYGDFKPGDRVTYCNGKWQGALLRRMARNSHDDWLVAWDDRTHASAKTANLRRAAEPPTMNAESAEKESPR